MASGISAGKVRFEIGFCAPLRPRVSGWDLGVANESSRDSELKEAKDEASEDAELREIERLVAEVRAALRDLVFERFAHSQQSKRAARKQ